MKHTLFVIAVVVLIGAGLWLAYAPMMQVPAGEGPNASEPQALEPSSNGSVSNAVDQEIRRVVTEFGMRMQQVSLLASTTGRTAAMNAAYGGYVAPELLAAWYPEGAEALGRYSSSPWPERIEIVEVKPVASAAGTQNGDRYVVEGNVIEVTSAEAGTGKAAAAVYPVTLTLENRAGAWLIIDAKKGAYSALPQRRTIVGYWECLPHKDRTGPQTMECAFGIAVDQSDAHYAVNTMLMSTYPVDFPTGTKVRVSGVVTPVEMLSSIQKYDIDGVINATEIVRVE